MPDSARVVFPLMVDVLRNTSRHSEARNKSIV